MLKTKIIFSNNNFVKDVSFYTVFDSIRYGITRFNEYFRRKDEFLALQYDN